MATVEMKNMTQTVNGKVTREAKDDSAMDRGKFYWWKKNGDDQEEQLANEIAGTVTFLKKQNSAREEQLLRSTRLYGNSYSYNVFGGSLNRLNTTDPGSTRISYNLCSSVIDTLTAQIAKNKVVPTFITSGGIWGMQRKAEKLSKFVEGAFYENNVHEKMVYQFRDGGVWGTGITHVYRDDKDRAAVERVFPHELEVDMMEAATTSPRQLHRTKIADRQVIAEMFPEHEDDIMQAAPISYQDSGAIGTAADLIKVVESWHLRSGEEAKDGLRVISLPDTGKILLKEEYKKDYFPFVFFNYSKHLIGFWGQGACERLQNLQGELNRLMILIQKSMWMGGSFKVLLENGSKVVSQHLNNEVGALIHYSGTKPEYITPPMIQQDIYPYVDSLITKGYQQEGVSQLAASNLKPMGVNSGAALRTYDNIADDRQLFIGQQIENACLETARQMIEVMKDVYKEKGKYTVNYPNTNFLESIDWGDIDLERDEYWLKAFPTSELPEEPVAKLETVQEYMQAGLISPRAGRRLLSMPDVEMSDHLANAAEELICKSIEDILYDKEMVRPDSEWDLQLAKQLSLQYMNYAKLNNCPEDRLLMLREFMGYIDEELGLTAPPAPMPGAEMPLANPMPTPQSNMVPNVAGAA